MATSSPLLSSAASADPKSEGPDAVAARQEEPQARVELLSERTASTTTWANPDGTTTVESYTGPIRVKQSDGGWKPVDTTLVADGGTIRPKAAAADITLSGGGKSRLLAEVSRGDNSLRLDWNGTLPAPELNGATATYRNAVEGGDLVVTALKEGISHSVVLNERPDGPVTYELPVQADGLTLEKASDQRLLWKDATGKAVATAPVPVMWGSGERGGTGEPEHLAAIDVTVKREPHGDGQVLVLKPDPAFLSDPDLEYPLTIDPTDSLLGPVTDTWIQYDDYLTSQRGSTELKSGTYNGTEKARSFLKFDAAKYAGKHILDTDLRLYSYYSSTCSTANSGNQVRRITTTWDPSAVSWSAQPSTTTTGAVTSTAAKGYNSNCPAGLVSWDVDAIVQAWADGQPNYGVRIAAVDEADPLTWRRYHSANQTDGSHNAAYEPSLSVTYNSLPGTAAAVAPASGSLTSDTTPTLSAKASDADGQQLTHTFEVWTSTGTSALRTGTSVAVASGAAATHTVEALPAGSYKWRARASDGTDTGAWSAWQTFTVDTTAPTAPTITSSSHPVAATWYTASSFSGSLAATDVSGIAGYAVKIDQNATTSPGTTVTQTATALARTGLVDGTWYVHAAAVDKAGLWSAARHFSLQVDATAPGAPGGLTSTTHPVATSAYANRTASFTWSAPADLSGVAGYAVTVDRTAESLPPTSGTPQTSASYTATTDADGTWYVHVRAKDTAGNWSSTAAHLPFRVDMNLSPSPVITSSSHPDQTRAYRSGDLTASWTAPPGSSAGYSLVVDKVSDTVPDAQPETTGTTHRAQLTEGTWYLHVRGIDGNGNGGATSHFRVVVDTTAPDAPAVTSADYPADAWAGDAGVTGSFQVTPPGTDTASLAYRVDGGASTTVPVTGSPVELRITPATAGSHLLTVTATDRAGNVSAETSRAFHVGRAAITAPGNGDILVGSVDLAVSSPAGLTEVTFLWRKSPTAVWESIPADQVTLVSDGSAVTWPVHLTNGVTPKLVWDTSSLSGSSSLQIGARFGGPASLPLAEPVSVTVDRIEIIEGGSGTDVQEAQPAQAYALEEATARAAAAPDVFAPPYIDRTTQTVVAPVVDAGALAEAAAPIQVVEAPADEGTGTPDEGAEGEAKPDGTPGESESLPALPADDSAESTGEENYALEEPSGQEEADQPAPGTPSVTVQVTPEAEVVAHSLASLESVRDEVLQLPESELPGSSALRLAYVDPENNRVVVETETVDSPLATALGERYGSDAVAAELVPTTPVETLDRRNDTSPYYGSGRIKSYLTTSSATWCTAGFPWRYDGKWYMLT
ncbi:DNRLRE domain-containing protein, partial [Streptomyces sp. NPDC005151]